MWPNETISERNIRLFGVSQPVAFITGSSAPRVGNAIATYLAAQRFHIVLHGHCNEHSHGQGHGQGNKEPARSDAGDGTQPTPPEELASELRTLQLSGAIQDEQNVVRWGKQLREEFGRIDVLVNSAAIWELKKLEETSGSDFERFFRVNALGTALTCKHFGLMMTQQDSGGAIINIGDWATHRPYRDFSAYFTSKGAVATLTHSMAIELASRNPRVRVNAILPGPVMMDESISTESKQRIAQDCLLRREGTAADVAAAVLFLATSPFITGVCLPVDGGRTISAGPSTDSLAFANR